MVAELLQSPTTQGMGRCISAAMAGVERAGEGLERSLGTEPEGLMMDGLHVTGREQSRVGLWVLRLVAGWMESHALMGAAWKGLVWERVHEMGLGWVEVGHPGGGVGQAVGCKEGGVVASL